MKWNAVTTWVWTTEDLRIAFDLCATDYRGDRVNTPPKLIETAQDLFENLES